MVASMGKQRADKSVVQTVGWRAFWKVDWMEHKDESSL